nr:hypothetical protein [uncultured bacterium]
MSKKKYINDKQLKQDFPLLFSESHKVYAKAPDGYFKDLPGTIIEKINAENDAEIIPIYRRITFNGLALFTSIAAVLIFGIFFMNYSPDQKILTDNNLIFTSSEISEISEDYLGDLDEDIIIEALLSDDMEFIDTDEEYTDYIYEHDIDIEEYIYEL